MNRRKVHFRNFKDSLVLVSTPGVTALKPVANLPKAAACLFCRMNKGSRRREQQMPPRLCRTKGESGKLGRNFRKFFFAKWEGGQFLSFLYFPFSPVHCKPGHSVHFAGDCIHGSWYEWPWNGNSGRSKLKVSARWSNALFPFLEKVACFLSSLSNMSNRQLLMYGRRKVGNEKMDTRFGNWKLAPKSLSNATPRADVFGELLV